MSAGIMTRFLGAAKIGRFYLAHRKGLVAATTHTQAAATLLDRVINQILTAAVSGDGVKLPVFEESKVLIVANDGAQTVRIYTNETSGVTIGAVAGSTGITLASGQMALFFGTTAGRWDVVQSVSTGVYTGTFDGVVGGGTPAAGTFTSLTATGAAILSGGVHVSGQGAITGGGSSSRTSATQLTAMINDLAVVSATTLGVILPAAVAGGICVLMNRVTASGHSLTVYGNGSDTVDGAAATTGVTLSDSATAGVAIFFCAVTGVWKSTMAAAVAG
jgi:hypothetical protein